MINSTYISLDGVVESPHLWPALGDDAGEAYKIQTELLLASDVLIMGRRTYEGFAPVWPTRSGDPASDKINTMPKHVVSSTLTDPEWNNTSVISGDPVEEIRRIKSENGGHLLQYGFGQLSSAMLENDLLDELRLWFHPLFVGAAPADHLLHRYCSPTQFALVDHRVLKNGIIVATYEVRPP